jgi:hypothetical protein
MRACLGKVSLSKEFVSFYQRWNMMVAQSGVVSHTVQVVSAY